MQRILLFLRTFFVSILSAVVFFTCQEDDSPRFVQKEYTYIFWTTLGDRTIERMILDKDQIMSLEILYGSIKGLVSPSAIVADESAQLIYWTDFATRQILRAPWDGNGNPEVLYTVPDDADGPVELTLDPVTQQLFWTQPFDDLILSAPANGNGPVDTVFNADDGINGAWGITLQVSEGYLYWIEYLDIELHRSRLDGSQQVLLYAGGSGFLKPFGLAVSNATNELFIVDNPVPGAGLPDRILKGSLDGKKKLETIYSLQDSVSNAYNIAIDEIRSEIYWHNQLDKGTIWRGSLDGSQQPVKLIDNINIGQGLAIAHVKRAPL